MKNLGQTVLDLENRNVFLERMMKFVLSVLSIENEPGTDGEPDTNDRGKSADSPDVPVDNSHVFFKERHLLKWLPILCSCHQEKVPKQTTNRLSVAHQLNKIVFWTKQRTNCMNQEVVNSNQYHKNAVLNVVRNERHQKEARKKKVVFLVSFQSMEYKIICSSRSYWRPTSAIRHLSVVFGALVSGSQE